MNIDVDLRDVQRKHVLIATPCYSGMVEHKYMMSIFKTVGQAQERGYDVSLFSNTDSLVPRARNNAVAAFLDGSWDYLFWIDADISFETDQFFRLLDANLDIAVAAYPLKRYFGPKITPDMDEESLRFSMLRYPIYPVDPSATATDDGFIMVSVATTGFMCIKRTVIETMREKLPDLKYQSDQTLLGAGESDNHYLFFDTMVKDGRYLSEDYAFCERARSVGFNIWLDVSSRLTHTGPHDFQGSILDTSRINS